MNKQDFEGWLNDVNLVEDLYKDNEGYQVDAEYHKMYKLCELAYEAGFLRGWEDGWDSSDDF